MQYLSTQRLVLSIAISSIIGSGVVWAEEGSNPEQETAGDMQSLPDVKIVADTSATTEGSDSYTTPMVGTATPLSMSMRNTPQSVSVVTRQRIEDQKLDDITDVINNVTGVSASEYDSSRHGYKARGFDIENLQIDGIPTTWSPGWSAGETQTSTIIYDRVEVVRGATGLMTGTGNPAASINLVRKHADSRTLAGNVSVEAGQWNTYGATADVSSPLVESGNIRGRIVGSYEQSDSFVDYREDETTVLYGVLDADITANTQLSLGASYQNNDPTSSAWGGLPVWYTDGSRTNWSRSKSKAPHWAGWASTNENYFATLTQHFSKDWNAQLRYDHGQNKGELKLLWVYGVPDRDTGLGMGASPSRYDTTRKQDTFTLNISGAYTVMGRKHEVAFGAINSDQDFSSYLYDREVSEVDFNFNEWDGRYPEPVWGETTLTDKQDTKETAFYAVTRLDLTEDLNVIVGGRLSDWETSGQNWQGPYAIEHDHVFLPYAGIIYDLSEALSAYASYADIFNPQSEQDATGKTLDPISGETYEIGLKAELMDGKLNGSLAVFQILQDNVAQPDGDKLVPGTIAQAYVQAEGAESRGYEIEVAGEVSPGLQLSLGWSQFTASDANGRAVNTSHPRRLLKVFSKYQFQGDLQGLAVGAGVNWQSGNYTNGTNPVTGEGEKLEQDAYALVSLMAKYAFNKELSAQLNVNNLLDETYYSQIGFYSQLAYGAPRNASVSLKYAF
ncbi:putative TonB-dependent receptor [Oleiphilus messinensis]|uniref:Putative TonB-dependent receptor n=1 Tax=Oleiphilus messinensis TaxID=141451 RepID=A0A1Y0IJ74_9GAMM|nr:TonB-dependent siderophore receptor [Oleiphilus messinensis]ARU59483.1 putative TonB-dependent receptor [Oleiphilus messinensis]